MGHQLREYPATSAANAVVVATVASSSGNARPGRAGHPPLIVAAPRVRREEIKPPEAAVRVQGRSPHLERRDHLGAGAGRVGSGLCQARRADTPQRRSETHRRPAGRRRATAPGAGVAKVPLMRLGYDL